MGTFDILHYHNSSIMPFLFFLSFIIENENNNNKTPKEKLVSQSMTFQVLCFVFFLFSIIKAQ